jgi:hypothetical protein
MSTPETQISTPEADATLSTGEVAWLIKILWPALQAPNWKTQSRKDLEKLGEALYSGKSLKELDDPLYNRIFPHLVKVATNLGRAIKKGPPSVEPPKVVEEKVTLDDVHLVPPSTVPGEE